MILREVMVLKAIKSSCELTEILCNAAGTGAYGSGEISLSPTGGGRFKRLFEGSIVMVKAVISASGKCGRKKLIELADNAAARLTAFSGEGIIRISAPCPAVITEAWDNGYIRIEREIEIIYRGV